MDFSCAPKVIDLQKRLTAFMDEHIYPAESVYHHEVAENRKTGNAWQPTKVMEELKAQAKAAGLWNLFLPESKYGAGLPTSNTRRCARSWAARMWRPRPSTARRPTPETWKPWCATPPRNSSKQWLRPLLDGTIRSAFAMTEPAVASSDATNIEARIDRDGGDYVINGRKWWTSGAPDPRCEILIFMGKTDPANPSRHRQQSMILVPMQTPGVTMERALPVFGYDHAPHGHGEVSFENVRVPVSNVLLGEGRGFEIAQGRLGPGRIHHCMRLIGLAERALELMCQVIDWAMQAHGGAGVCDDFPLAAAYASARTLRFADGPDEVHRNQIGKMELARYQSR